MNIINARFLGSSFNVGDNIEYVCEPGSVHTSGDLVRTCTKRKSDLEWSGTKPVCTSEKYNLLIHELFASNDEEIGKIET